MLADLIYINGIIATELINVSENTATIRHGNDYLDKTNCSAEHQDLNKKILEIVKKYQRKTEDTTILANHVLKHSE